MPGPLPQESRRRTNAPVIPTTLLPAGGNPNPAPKLPPNHGLRKAGRAWWRWAWSTPQAAGWALGHEGLVARRASFEDDLEALHEIEGLDLDGLGDDAQRVRQAVQSVAALATGKLQLCREMRELDDRLGLSPKAMAQLRWKIVADDEGQEQQPQSPGGNVITPPEWQRTGT